MTTFEERRTLLTTWPEKAVLFLDRAKERGSDMDTGEVLTPVGVTPKLPALEGVKGMLWTDVMYRVLSAMLPGAHKECTLRWFMSDGYNYRVMIPMSEMEPFWKSKENGEAKQRLPDGFRLVTLWEIDQGVLASVLFDLVRAQDGRRTKLQEIAEQLRNM